jgi:hypothetical protein
MADGIVYELEAMLKAKDEEIAALKHDLERYMTIANNEAQPCSPCVAAGIACTRGGGDG